MISILLPISDKEQPELIEVCLNSLAGQTYKNFEVLLVTSRKKAARISKITKKHVFVKVLKKKLDKSAARNFAAKRAKGRYLYHLDVDMAPTPSVLSECIKEAQKGAKAIIIPDSEAPGTHLITRCRRLERRLLRGSTSVIAPLFLSKKLFEKAGKYDESLDPADDWNLHIALRNVGVKFNSISAQVLVKETTSIKKALKKKYKMGRIYPAIKEKYPHPALSNPKLRISDYLRNSKELFRSPFVTLCLFVLKIGEAISFYWGTFHPVESQNRYKLSEVAKKYDQKRLGSNYGQYKHFAELKSLYKLLPKKDVKILEIGCGTGRITERLVKQNYKITPIDSSPAMLDQYKQKSGLPKPKLASTTQLPFPDNSFPIVFSLRVIWHLTKADIDTMLSEVARVSSNLVIFDITNKKRWPKIYRNQYPNEYFFNWKEFTTLCKQFNLKVEERIPLDITTPIWINILPPKLVTALFPLIYQADLLLAKLIPPGRYLVKLIKQT